MGAALVASIAALGYFLGPRDGRTRSSTAILEGTPDARHIAVLYFRDQSADGALRHVANGLTEELIDELSHVEALRVVSPSGVRPYRDAAVGPNSIARAFNVGSLVEGSVTTARGKVVVTVRLVDATTGLQIESTSLERRPGDLFLLQRDLAEEVAHFLRRRIGQTIVLRERRAATGSVAAWEAVRRADALIEDADALARAGTTAQAMETLGRADSLLSRAEELDSRWSEPVVHRGWVSRARADVSEPGDEGMWLRDGIAHGVRALQLRSNDPAALEMRGYLTFRLSRTEAAQRGDEAVGLLANAERDLRAAVIADPSRAHAWNTLGLLHYMRGEFREARLTLNRGIEADAYLSEAATNLQLLFFTALELGDPDSARVWCALGVTRFARDPRFTQCDLIVLGWTGRSRRDAARAWGAVDDMERRDSGAVLAGTWGFRRMMVAAVLVRAGLRDSAEAVLRTTRERAPDAGAILDLELYEACVLATLGAWDRSLERLGAYLRRMPQDADWVAHTRWFQPLRDNPAFQALLAATRGLPDS